MCIKNMAFNIVKLNYTLVLAGLMLWTDPHLYS